AGRFQLRAQGLVVFDDAVVHHGDPAGHVRVRVVLAGRAMRGPARVRDAGAARERPCQVTLFHLAHFAPGAHALDAAFVEPGQAGGVVAALFQGLQAGDEDGGYVTLGDGGDDSTHVSISVNG